jgi:hypothetical protein
MSPPTLPRRPGEEHLDQALATLLEQAGVEPWLSAPGRGLRHPVWGAQVRVDGAWEAEVCLRVEEGLALRLAAGLFGEEALELQDAVGEMANILAGHVKASLGLPARLGVPLPLGSLGSGPGPEATVQAGEGVLTLSVALLGAESNGPKMS